jgi:hypothetical protein
VLPDGIPLFTGPAAEATTNPFLTTGDALARSLNRVRLVAAPGVATSEGILGHTASELLSAAAICELVREAAGALGLSSDDPRLLHAFNRCFDDPRARPAGLAIADIAGRRLGVLLLVLWRGDPANRAARPEWGDAHWGYWRAVRRVVIGGGLFAGRLGAAAVPVANDFLAAAGCPIAVERSPWGVALPLAGLARHAPPDAARMLLFDFGHTSVKRGLAIHRDSELVEVIRRPSLPAPGRGALDESQTTTARRWHDMRALIVADWRALHDAGQAESTAIGLVLAAHLRDGHTLDSDRSGYGRLGRLAPHLASFLRDELASTLGRFRSLALLHDGLAAASLCAGQPGTVALTLGTAIGAGYTPPVEGLRPLAESLIAPDELT